MRNTQSRVNENENEIEIHSDSEELPLLYKNVQFVDFWMIDE